MTRTAVPCAQGLSGAQVQCLSGVIRRSGPAARRTDTAAMSGVRTARPPLNGSASRS
jgi:hypothetical protein